MEIHETLEARIDSQVWHIYQGSIRAFICGPGMGAWFPVSAANYKGGPTPKEMRIARKALSVLMVKFHGMYDATAKDIRKALEEAGWEPDEFTKYPTE
jgi:hypothetical protein